MFDFLRAKERRKRKRIEKLVLRKERAELRLIELNVWRVENILRVRKTIRDREGYREYPYTSASAWLTYALLPTPSGIPYTITISHSSFLKFRAARLASP
jgi:hypothetical protein